MKIIPLFCKLISYLSLLLERIQTDTKIKQGKLSSSMKTMKVRQSKVNVPMIDNKNTNLKILLLMADFLHVVYLLYKFKFVNIILHFYMKSQYDLVQIILMQ